MVFDDVIYRFMLETWTISSMFFCSDCFSIW